MTAPTLDVVGIGNAIMDVISHTEVETMEMLHIEPATMTLIDLDRARFLLEAMGPSVQLSGGSVGNTIAGLSSLGAEVGYIGKVADDTLGQAFRHDMTSLGVTYTTPPSDGGVATAHSLIFVTPDGQRSMNTYLGACVELTSKDIDAEMIGNAKILYLEGYLFDPPKAQQAFYEAAKIAHDAGRKVALTLSDPFCVDRHRDAFRDLVENHVDILFANELELLSFVQMDNWEDAVDAIAGKVSFAALTKGSNGSVIIADGQRFTLPAVKPAAIVDTTGAGDLYAAGVLFGIVSGYSPQEAGWLGSLAASEVIAHFGGRAEVSLTEYVAARWHLLPWGAQRYKGVAPYR